ncbi:hypothetical protein [Hungatella sp.]|uniref:hypothetical protein n=1 Tax=Hungatella sp. TaxID=2613924 RepID=UPI0039922A91
MKIDLMLELVTHLSSAQFVSSYMQKNIVKEGILLQDAAGNFTLGGDPLPAMSDIEVYVHDDELNQDVWKRVFIGGGTREKRICGLRHPGSLFRSPCENPRLVFPGKVHKKIRQHTVQNHLRYPDRSFFFIS